MTNGSNEYFPQECGEISLFLDVAKKYLERELKYTNHTLSLIEEFNILSITLQFVIDMSLAKIDTLLNKQKGPKNASC